MKTYIASAFVSASKSDTCMGASTGSLRATMLVTILLGYYTIFPFSRCCDWPTRMTFRTSSSRWTCFCEDMHLLCAFLTSISHLFLPSVPLNRVFFWSKRLFSSGSIADSTFSIGTSSKRANWWLQQPASVCWPTIILMHQGLGSSGCKLDTNFPHSAAGNK